MQSVCLKKSLFSFNFENSIFSNHVKHQHHTKYAFHWYLHKKYKWKKREENKLECDGKMHSKQANCNCTSSTVFRCNVLRTHDFCRMCLLLMTLLVIYICKFNELQWRCSAHFFLSLSLFCSLHFFIFFFFPFSHW